MKQIFLLFALAATCMASAQCPHFCGKKKGCFPSVPQHNPAVDCHDSIYMYKGCSADTELYTYAFTGDTTGYASGMNQLGYYGFAERYNYNATDSSIKVLGVAAIFTGKVNPASPRVVDIKIWNVGDKIFRLSTHLFYSGFPSTAVNSTSIHYTDLGVSDTAVVLKEFYFPTESSIGDGFFVGYTMNYSWETLSGDTLAIATTKNGNRATPVYTVYGGDTIVDVQNATLTPVDVWVDNGYDLNLQLNYWMFPIVNSTVISHEGISRHDFTFYGNYPNPAVTSTAVKFALTKPSGVKLQLIDAAGHAVKTIDEPFLGTGDHIIQLPTSDLAPGNYSYVIRTIEGDGIVGRLSVIR